MPSEDAGETFPLSGLEAERLQIERERLELDKRKLAFEQRFVNRNLAPILAASVALIGAIIAAGPVWVAQISKSKEVQIAKEQKGRDEAQREREFAVLQVQQEREWSLNVAKFVAEHSNVIFGGNKEQRGRIARVIAATFPPNIANSLLGNLESTTAALESRKTWSSVREELRRATNAHVHGQVGDVDTGKPLSGVTVTFIDNVSSFVTRSITGSSGEFAVDLQAPPSGGTYRVVGEHPNFLTRNDFVPIKPGDTVVQFNLYPKQKN